MRLKYRELHFTDKVDRIPLLFRFIHRFIYNHELFEMDFIVKPKL
ncbi:hypothetical protein DFP79_1620 [Marinomonas balearica]|uniref:Uncharacterized protein n=1 Tax=Marinomonas balearica TaxID=491947 RepID=A0A4R6M908_9GAMM|nr:hypothetical protein DFP79_1620 [Marinomonas balearica]